MTGATWNWLISRSNLSGSLPQLLHLCARMLAHGCQDQIPDVAHCLSRRGEKPEFRRAAVAVARAECELLAGR